MRLRGEAFLIFLTLALIAAAVSAEDGSMLVPAAPGVHERTIEPDGLTLRWAVQVPEGLSAATPRPLVLALHYGFDSNRSFPSYYGRGFLERVVAPGLEALGAVLMNDSG